MAKSTKKYPERAKEVSVTQAMLFAVRDELKETIKSESKRTDRKISGLRSDFHVVKSAIHGMKSEIHEVKAEVHGLKSEIHEVKAEVHGLKSEIHEVKAEVHGLKSEIHEVKAEVHGLKSEIHEVKAEFHGVKAELHRVALLVEEQNARNAIVMDGLTNLFARQDRVEQELNRTR